MKFLAWLLSLFFAFNLGAETASPERETDEALRNRVQEHIDVIVDEGAAIVDELADSIRNDERVQDAQQFIQDAQEIAEETLQELNQVVEDTKDRVQEKFGPAEEDVKTDGAEEPEIAPSPDVLEGPEEPASGEPVNG